MTLSPEAQKARRGFVYMLIGFAIVFIVCLVIWALTGGGYFWPIWPLLGWLGGGIYAWWRIRKVQ